MNPCRNPRNPHRAASSGAAGLAACWSSWLGFSRPGQSWRRDRTRRGQTIVEYGLMVALVSVAIVLVLGAFGKSTTNLVDHIGEKVDEANAYGSSGNDGAGGDGTSSGG